MSELFVPPRNIDAERAVLGGAMLDGRAIMDLPAELKPQAFYLPTHGRIFEAMLGLCAREAPIDVVSVSTEAKLEASVVIEIQEFGMPQSIAYHAGLVLEAYRQRCAIQRVSEALRELQEQPHRHEEIMGQLYSASDEGSRRGAVHIETVMLESLRRIEKAGDKTALIPTGFSGLDQVICGFERGDLVIVAGRPSMGKTAFSLDIGRNAAERGLSVFIVSVETVRDKLGLRMLSHETNINGRRFRTGTFEDRDFPRLVSASGKLSRLPIHILDRDPSWPSIKREIRRRKRSGLDLVILDYLTLLDLPQGKNDRRDIVVGQVAREAKQIAISLDLVFVLVCQLNRKAEERSDPEPIMSDLRDSGEIEQAADLIIFPFRPVIYDPDFRPRDKAFLKVAKARDLPTGKIPVRFNAEITSFSDWTER